MKSKETIYRSPDGQRWRLVDCPRWGGGIMAIRVKDGWVRWKNDDLHKFIEESEWLKNRKK
jgi:hypothetical protein